MGMLVMKEYLYTRTRKVIKEGIISNTNTFQIINTLVFCFSIALFVIILGLFISDRMKMFLLSQHDDYFYIYPNQNMTTGSSKVISSSISSSSSSLIFESSWVAPKELNHSMSDEELIWRASMAPHVAEYPFKRTPKVAFMFLTRGRLPLGPIWERFFKGHDQKLFSIYLHCSPDFTEEPLKSSVFYGRKIPSKVRTCFITTPTFF